MHDGGVALLARDLASRTGWTVRAGAPGFAEPAASEGDMAPDILCERGRDTPPIAVEVELPETLVRRETVRRLRRYVDSAVDIRVAVIADEADHAITITETRRMLRFRRSRYPGRRGGARDEPPHRRHLVSGPGLRARSGAI